MVWKALGSTESVRDMWMDAETWVRLLKSNCTLSLRMTSGIELTETFLNEIVWKDRALKDVVGLEQNNVGLHRHAMAVPMERERQRLVSGAHRERRG